MDGFHLSGILIIFKVGRKNKALSKFVHPIMKGNANSSRV